MRIPAFSAPSVQLVTGSSLFWAWIDSALFKPTLFNALGGTPALFPTAFIAAVLVCALSLLGGATASRRTDRLLGSPLCTTLLSVGAVAGGALVCYGSATQSIATVIAGSFANGIVFGLGVLLWGRIYSIHGARSASLYLPSTIALAVLISLAVGHLSGLPSACVTLLLPVASFSLESLGIRSGAAESNSTGVRYLAARIQGEPNSAEKDTIFGTFRDHKPFGLDWNIACSFLLFGIAFGFLQNQAVLSSSDAIGQNADILLAARGITAVALLVATILMPRRLHVIYRVGLMIMIAGFMVMPFSMIADTAHPIALSVIPTIGYACFDIMSWVVVAEICFCSHLASEVTVGFGRGLIHGGVGLGALVGSAAASFTSDQMFWIVATTSVGYLLVIAVVLIVGDTHGLWSLLKHGSAYQGEPIGRNDDFSHRMALFGLHYGLSDREREIAELFGTGRSTKAIAEQLFISENTVKSHLRHAYAKSGVHNRQELLDALEQLEFID